MSAESILAIECALCYLQSVAANHPAGDQNVSFSMIVAEDTYRRRFPLEAFLWIAALGALACSDPAASSDYSLCPLKNLGFAHCPGCNIGHAIAFLLHGQLHQSIAMHWLGIPAVLILTYRIITLLHSSIHYR